MKSSLETLLVSQGWQFDAQREQFTDGTRRIDYRRILALMPDMTMDDLANFVNEKHEEWLANKGEARSQVREP
jgi:hypothetical protein